MPLAVAASGADGVAKGEIVIEVHAQTLIESVFQSVQLVAGQRPAGLQVVAEREMVVVMAGDVAAAQRDEQEWEKNRLFDRGYLSLLGNTGWFKIR